MEMKEIKKTVFELTGKIIAWYLARPSAIRIGLGALVIGVITGIVLIATPMVSREVAGLATHVVKKGDLTISVVENGSLKAAKIELKRDPGAPKVNEDGLWRQYPPEGA